MALAVRRLAAEKAPSVASQLVLWNVAAGLDWDVIAPDVGPLGRPPRRGGWPAGSWRALMPPRPRRPGGSSSKVEGDDGLAASMAKLAKDGSLLGLKVEDTLLDAPEGPSLAFTIVVDAAKAKAEVAVRSSNGQGRWIDAGKLTVPVTQKDGK